MATEIHKQTHPITAFSTTQVKVFPTRALVTRSLPSLTIRPGRNKITITNLTASAEEESIKVEGIFSGEVEGENAVISDINVDYLPDAMLWSEEQDEDSSDGEVIEQPEEASEQRIAELAGEEAVKFLEELKDLRDERETFRDTLESLRQRMNVINAFGQRVGANVDTSRAGFKPTEVLQDWLKIQQTELESLKEEQRVTKKTRDQEKARCH
jgi:hypothetical protein